MQATEHKATFSNDTKFFKRGDEFVISPEDSILKFGKNPLGRRRAVFAAVDLPDEIADRLGEKRVYFMGFIADDLERPAVRVIIYYRREKMARADWAEIKAAIQSESPVVWQLVHQRKSTKSVDYICD